MTESANSTPAPSRQMNGVTYPKPRRKPVRIGRQRRERIEAAVDGLLRLLDAIDGDPDEEPSLGYTMPGVLIDAEGPDDNGIADSGGEAEQLGRAV